MHSDAYDTVHLHHMMNRTSSVNAQQDILYCTGSDCMCQVVKELPCKKPHSSVRNPATLSIRLQISPLVFFIKAFVGSNIKENGQITYHYAQKEAEKILLTAQLCNL